jgi:hypothetical protein
MTAIRRSISVAAVALGLLGCGQRFDYTGTWRGERTLELTPETDRAMANTLRRVELTIKPDGRFVLVQGGLPKEGRVHYGGDRASLEVETILGQPAHREGDGRAKGADPEVTPTSEGKLQIYDPAELGPERILLSRLPQPKG